MSGNLRDEGHDASFGDSGGWADRLDRYLVPAAGLVVVALGISLMFDLKLPWTPYAPLVLVALGGGMLSNTLAGLAARGIAHPVGELPAAVPAVATAATHSSPAANELHHRSHPIRRALHELHGPTPTQPPAATANYHPTPGDFLWGSWVPPTRKLPGELVGPVPETAYTAPREGRPTLHAEGEPIVMGPMPTVAHPGAASSSLLDDTEFDRLRTLPDRNARDLQAPASGRARAAHIPSLPGVRASISGGVTHRVPYSDNSDSPAPERWAIPKPLSRSPNARANTGQARPTRCASCRLPIGESKVLRRCFACLRRLCADCAATAARTRDGLWCRRCAEAEHTDGLSLELARRARSSPSELHRSSFSTAVSDSAA